MRKIILLMVLCAIIIGAFATFAQAENLVSITPRIAYNYANDGDTRDYLGNTFGVLVDVTALRLPVGFEVGYMAGSKTEDEKGLPGSYERKGKYYEIPIMVTYKHNTLAGLYLKAGLGVSVKGTEIKYDYNGILDDAKEKANDTNFAYKLGVGYKFTQNLSAEVFYYDSGKTELDDLHWEGKGKYLQFNLGYTF